MSLRYFPLEETDFRLKIGLRALKDSWLDPDEDLAKDLDEKYRLLKTERSMVYAAVEGTDEAQEDIYRLVRLELSKSHPQLSVSAQDMDNPALIRAALLVQEDLVLMRRKDDAYFLAAACVCFPTGWNLREKVGHSMHHIHGPVPGLNSAIGTSIDRFFLKLRPGKIVERFNWGLYDSKALFQSADWRSHRPPDPTITQDTVGERIFFRVERQTLQRLGDRDDILFTIRIYNTPLGTVTADTDRSRRLQHAISTMGKKMQHYKSFPRYAQLVENHLKQRCSLS